MSKNGTIFIVLLVILVLVLFVSNQVNQEEDTRDTSTSVTDENEPSETSAEASETDIIPEQDSDWLVYRNEEEGIEFKYPAEMTYTEKGPSSPWGLDGVDFYIEFSVSDSTFCLTPAKGGRVLSKNI